MIAHLELSADFLRLKSHRGPLADFKVPGAEHFHCQNPMRLEDVKPSPEGCGHAAEGHSH